MSLHPVLERTLSAALLHRQTKKECILYLILGNSFVFFTVFNMKPSTHVKIHLISNVYSKGNYCFMKDSQIFEPLSRTIMKNQFFKVMVPLCTVFAFWMSFDRLFCLRHIYLTLYGKGNKYISYFSSNGILQHHFFQI